MTTTLEGMTQERWSAMTQYEREQAQDLSGLSAQLKQWKGYRVEVVTDYGVTRRFIVGQSMGWKPCTLEIHNRRSMGGQAAESHYKSVRVLYKAR